MRYFSPETDPKLYRCSCGKCDTKPSAKLLEKLDKARGIAGVPFVVTSGPRCSAYNEEIGGAVYSEHTDGDGADIDCEYSRNRYRIIKAAIMVGINRIGIGKDFIHLGVSETNDQDVIWVYS